VNVIGVQHIQQNVENEPLCRDLCNIIYESRFMLKKKEAESRRLRAMWKFNIFLGRVVWVWSANRRETHMTSFRA